MYVGFESHFLVLQSEAVPGTTEVDSKGRRIKAYTCMGLLTGSGVPVTLTYNLEAPLRVGTLAMVQGHFMYDEPAMKLGATEIEPVDYVGDIPDFRCSIRLFFDGFVGDSVNFRRVDDTETLMHFECHVYGPRPMTLRCFLRNTEQRREQLPVIYEGHKVSIIAEAVGFKDGVVFVNIISYAFFVYPPSFASTANILYRPDTTTSGETKLSGDAKVLGVCYPFYKDPGAHGTIAQDGSVSARPDERAPPSTPHKRKRKTKKSPSAKDTPQTDVTARTVLTEAPSVPDAAAGPDEYGQGSPKLAATSAYALSPSAADVPGTPLSPAPISLQPTDVQAPTATFLNALEFTAARPFTWVADTQTAAPLGSPIALATPVGRGEADMDVDTTGPSQVATLSKYTDSSLAGALGDADVVSSPTASKSLAGPSEAGREGYTSMFARDNNPTQVPPCDPSAPGAVDDTVRASSSLAGAMGGQSALSDTGSTAAARNNTAWATAPALGSAAPFASASDNGPQATTGAAHDGAGQFGTGAPAAELNSDIPGMAAGDYNLFQYINTDATFQMPGAGFDWLDFNVPLEGESFMFAPAAASALPAESVSAAALPEPVGKDDSDPIQPPVHSQEMSTPAAEEHSTMPPASGGASQSMPSSALSPRWGSTLPFEQPQWSGGNATSDGKKNGLFEVRSGFVPK